MKKYEKKSISERQWVILQEKVNYNSKMILKFLERVIGTPEATIFIQDEIHMSVVCLAIYTHAVEEYGKLLYLKSLHPDKKKIVIIDGEKFLDHKTKFDLAREYLSEFTKLEHTIQGESFDVDWHSRLDVWNVDIDVDGDATNIKDITTFEVLRKVVFELYNKLLQENTDEITKTWGHESHSV